MKNMKEKLTWEKIRTSNLCKVFNAILEKVGEEPERVWNQFWYLRILISWVRESRNPNHPLDDTTED